MPNPGDFDNEKDWMGACVPMRITEGDDQDQAVAVCMAMWRDHMGMKLAVKALGDWELDVTAAPYGLDSDQQTMDEKTDFMLEQFGNPAILYHHGIEPGKQALQKKPVIIGKTIGIERRADGLHVRVLLDKTIEYARRVWEAAKNGIAVASSDSISHLARLEVAGKLVMYEKDRPGRIAVWPLAGLSLWDAVEGNFRPASRYAIALPAMKAIYREAGLPFPDIHDPSGTNGGSPEAAGAAVKRAKAEGVKAEARKRLVQVDEIRQRALDYLNHIEE